MHHTSPNHKHAAVLEVTNTLALYQPILKNLQTSQPQQMEKSTQNAEY